MNNAHRCRLGCACFIVLAVGLGQGASALARDMPVPTAATVPPLAPGEQWVSPDMLFDAAAQAVRQRAGQGPATRLELAMPQEGIRGLVVAGGALQLVAKSLPAERPWSPRLSVWVDVMQKGELRRSVLVPLLVKAWQRGWVARRDLPAGTVLNADQLREDEVDVAAGGSIPQVEPAGRVLRSMLLAGRYVGALKTVQAKAVQRGDRVELLHRMGAVEVLASAEALQDGEPGEHVQVRLQAAGGAVLARVMSAGKVELIK